MYVSSTSKLRHMVAIAFEMRLDNSWHTSSVAHSSHSDPGLTMLLKLRHCWHCSSREASDVSQAECSETGSGTGIHVHRAVDCHAHVNGHGSAGGGAESLGLNGPIQRGVVFPELGRVERLDV